MPPEPTFEWSIATVVKEQDSSPWVNLSIWYHMEPGEPKKLIATWQWSPNEARQRGLFIQQAAEAAESDASVVMVMRSMKIPEDQIQQVIQGIRNRREMQ